ncbi:MAG: hypothetical protein WCK32_00885 [Chlorobiaceae bacterium]
MSDTNTKKLLSLLHKDELIDILCQSYPWKAYIRDLEIHAYHSLNTQLTKKVDNCLSEIKALDRTKPDYRRTWWALQNEITKLWKQQDKLSALMYPPKKEQTS